MKTTSTPPGEPLYPDISDVDEMRLKRLQNQFRCYLTPDEYQTLLANAPHDRGGLVLRLGAECGLRVSETLDARPSHVRESAADAPDAFFLIVPEGKDTSGETAGKWRSTFLPEDLLRESQEYCFRADHVADPSDHVFNRSKRTLQKDVERAGEAAAEASGDEDFLKVSSHDLRAYFATDCLIRRNMNHQVVMEVGGWADHQSIEPYLNAGFDDAIVQEFRAKPPSHQ